MQSERFGRTRRGGPVFRWLGEPLAIDLANTVMVVREDETVDLLAAPEDLRRWLEAERGRLGECEFGPADLDRIRTLRDAIRELLGAVAEQHQIPIRALDRVNAASAAAPVAPQLNAELIAAEQTGDEASIDWLLGALARSAIALLAGPEREQLRVCRAPSCGMFFLGARRWCCAACGNRARAARHYRRTKGSAPSRGGISEAARRGPS
jgi:predicted RNA-binding Zn ribbon-like protein